MIDTKSKQKMKGPGSELVKADLPDTEKTRIGT